MLEKFLIGTVIAAAIAVGSFYTGYQNGIEFEKGQHAIAEAKAVKIVDKVETKLDETKTEVDKVATEKQTEIKIVYKTVEKEVIKYVANETKSETNLGLKPFVDVDWLHIYANSSQNCKDAGFTCITRQDISDTSVTYADLLQNITDAHEQYYLCKSDYAQLRDLYKKQASIVNNINKDTTNE